MLRAIILIIAFAAVQGSNNCVEQSFGPGRIVCVCNSTYCDTIDEPELRAGQFQWYTSTEDGLRLQLTVGDFSSINNENNGLILIVNSSQAYQSIHGFGGAMTDATALNIRTLSNETQQILLEQYFGSRSGIGYTHVRIPIAGTDFSTRPYTYDDTAYDVTLSNFSLVEEDEYKIHYLNYIKSIMPDPESLRIFCAAWSAPWWMKSTKSIRGGFLEPQYYETYAEYVKKFYDAYKEHGVEIWGMTPGNEPMDGAAVNFSFNSMLWTPRGEAFWSAEYLAPTLSNAGYNPVYMAMDDQRFELPWYPNTMFLNPKAKKLFGGIAYHWYTDYLFSPMRLDITHRENPDKFILMTEACTGSSSWDIEKVVLGSWNRGLAYILDIIQNLSHWVVGWVDWNMALNATGGPNWANNFVDSPIIVIPENDEFYKQPMFYALAHVSRFVPRYSYRIYSEGLDNPNLRAIAFYTPEQRIVVVIVNMADQPFNVTVKSTNMSEHTINLEIPANSFNTLLYLEQQ
ncbi:hypothetical protein DMN91_000885 [Ooceraea biroi]|uniref:Glucosylceramidase n=1 Tax=Ooceraea biroi TaxID=2015173 RepID=A0A026WL55_OOCBI|nr:glucosylceramidase [Ooceraea biroi]EZA56663.1 Glucosylceramidase [Ooceraea biroi]RLU27086.1 hypothetical protein DMN91_000885 [Ooceraea biroi]